MANLSATSNAAGQDAFPGRERAWRASQRSGPPPRRRRSGEVSPELSAKAEASGEAASERRCRGVRGAKPLD